jgi:hypothetical protein
MFDVRPRCVQRLITALQRYNKLIVLGSSSQGKTYTTAIYALLSWLQDPSGTAWRLISVTGSHARDVAFSAIQRAYSESIIPFPGHAMCDYIGNDNKDRHAGISLISVRDGQSGRNAVQGLHPQRRPRPSLLHGDSTRCRIMIDECENVPSACYTGLENFLGNLEVGTTRIQSVLCCNPFDLTSRTAQLAEPIGGWSSLDIDLCDEYESRENFHVLRLDAAKSENVLLRRKVFAGFQTYEGFKELERNSSTFMGFGRGMYNLTAAADQIIPYQLLAPDRFFGQYIFHAGTTTDCAAVDLAFRGDDVVLFWGTYGQASSYLLPGSSAVAQLSETRWVLQLNNYFTLPKLLTQAQYHQIKDRCETLGVPLHMLAVDSTGVGQGVADLFVENHYDILPISWDQGATEQKILDEDRHVAKDLYLNISAELWFGVRAWLEADFIRANSNIEMSRIKKELLGRRWKRSSRISKSNQPLFAVEAKEEYKGRNMGKSPDVADSLCMLLMLVSMRGQSRAQRAPVKKVISQSSLQGDDASIAIKPIDWSEAA